MFANMDFELRDKLGYCRTVNKNTYKSIVFSDDHDVLLLAFSTETGSEANKR
jgi:hypothetical protein